MGYFVFAAGFVIGFTVGYILRAWDEAKERAKAEEEVPASRL